MEKLEYATNKVWKDKSRLELEEIVTKGVQEINDRASTIKLPTERQFLKDIREMQGMKDGLINPSVEGLTDKELIYRARKIDRFLKTDKSSLKGIAQLTDISEEARMTFNANNPGKNFSKLQYREMVELMFAFGKENEGMDSNQIQAFFENAEDVVTANELARIFADAETYNGGESEKMEYVYSRIDELRALRGR